MLPETKEEENVGGDGQAMNYAGSLCDSIMSIDDALLRAFHFLPKAIVSVSVSVFNEVIALFLLPLCLFFDFGS